MVPARLNVVTLGTRDLAALRAFYRGFGWPMVEDLPDFASFQTTGALLSLFPLERLAADGNADAAAPERGMRGFTLAMVVEAADEVDRLIAQVRELGGRITKEPVDATEFEGRSAYFADPEDNFWEVVYLPPASRMAIAARSAAGSGRLAAGPSKAP